MQEHQQSKKRFFTASEVAEYEYCSLVWWHEQFEPLAQLDTEELFARMVELEHEHDSQAPALPEYQLLERLLLRRGAFENGQQQHLEHAQQVEEVEEERRMTTTTTINGRTFMLLIALIVLVACVLIGLALVVH